MQARTSDCDLCIIFIFATLIVFLFNVAAINNMGVDTISIWKWYIRRKHVWKIKMR